MEIQSNSRQIPKTKDCCSDKRYSDIIYAYFQALSLTDTDDNGGLTQRYVPKSMVNYVDWAKKFDLTRQTVSKRIKGLQERGLVSYDEKKKIYRLTKLENKTAALIPFDTVKFMVDALSDNAISAYVYFLNRFIAEGEKPYVFTLVQVKDFLGLGTASRSNDDTITNILFALQKLGLNEYSMTASVQEETSFKNVKTIYRIDKVVNQIKVLKK